MNNIPRYYLSRSRNQTIVLAALIILSITAVSGGIYNLVLVSGEREQFGVLDPGSLRQAAYIKYYGKQTANTPLLFSGNRNEAAAFIQDVISRTISPVTSYHEVVPLQESVYGFMKTYPFRIKASLQTRELFSLLDNLSGSRYLFSADSLDISKSDDNKDNLISSSRLYLEGRFTLYAVDDSLYKQFRSGYKPVNTGLQGSADIFYGYGFFAKDPPDAAGLTLIKFSEAGAHFLNEDDELYILKPGGMVKNGVLWEINEKEGKVKLLLWEGKPEIVEISVAVN